MLATTVPASVDEREASARWMGPCPRSEDGRHVVSVEGYVRGRGAVPGHLRLLCARPVRVVCGAGCGGETAWPCRCHREHRCKPCARNYQRRLSRHARHGLALLQARQRNAYHLTLTAPGDPGHAEFIPGRPGKHGSCSCWQAARNGLGRWNAGAGQRWNHFATTLRRHSPGAQYWRGAEVQLGSKGGRARGAIHYHVLLAVNGSLDVMTVRRWALAAGFGCNVRLDPVRSSAGAARYVSKYVTKGCSDRWTVPWRRDVVDRSTGEITTQLHPTYRAWSCSREWGPTMRDMGRQARDAAVQRWDDALALLSTTLGAEPLVPQGIPELT